ncbi:metallophosphoesterase family protein, partial [Candidatus Micrarchaeota archaeon]|nr:metallophosphoesterase family protein [Candidatus Micrarchaeota archaeon]
LSDLHVGSKKFMRENFQRFLKFLNGDCTEEEKKVAGKIKYLLIAGDLVDGIGAYPTQERELLTKDIYEQYEIFCELLKGIPEWIEVVAIPGNHDAVRIAEPQPSLPSELTKTLGERGNIHFAPSPTQVELHGVRVLMYHGNSVDSIISGLNISKGYHHPELIGIEMLRRRHLAPIYGDKPLLPTERDALVISNPPDIMHFGHVHKNGYAEYHGTTVINSGTWQEKTEYQIKQGHIVTPCLLPLYDLQTGVIKTLNFT